MLKSNKLVLKTYGSFRDIFKLFQSRLWKMPIHFLIWGVMYVRELIMGDRQISIEAAANRDSFMEKTTPSLPNKQPHLLSAWGPKLFVKCKKKKKNLQEKEAKLKEVWQR